MSYETQLGDGVSLEATLKPQMNANKSLESTESDPHR